MFCEKVMVMKKNVTKSMKTFWGVGEIGEGFFSSIGALYFSYFLTDIALLPVGYVSAILLFTGIVDFIISPLSGALIEGSKPMRWGKLRSWVLICPFVVLIASPMEYIKWTTPLLTSVMVIIFYVVNSVAFNTMVTANYSLVPSMCAYEDERSILSSNRMTGSNIGRLVMGWAAPLLIIGLVESFGDYGYATIMFIACVLMLIGYMIHFRLSKGYEGNGSASVSDEERLSVKDMFKAVISNPQLIPLMISDMTSTLGSFLLPTLVVYMYKYVIGNIVLMSTHNLVTGIGGMLGAYSSRFFMKKFENRKAVCLMIYPCIAFTVFCTRFVVDTPVAFIAICGLLQFFIGITQPVESTLYYDVATYTEWKTGKDSTALIIGLTNLPIKLAGIVKNVVISALLVAVNYDANVGATPELRAGLINAFSLVTCVIPIIGWISLKFFYKINPELIKKCKKENAERRAVNNSKEE